MKDSALEKTVAAELARQRETINLIPSENYASKEILALLGSPLTNKYSEGYPGKRYYPGNALYDAVERMAIERVKKAFRLGSDWHVNVQPYSGSGANLAAYLALMQPGETLLGMGLAAGGHLSHGHRVAVPGRLFHSVQYGLGSDGLLDYVEIERMAIQHQAKVIVSGVTSYPRALDFAKFGHAAKKAGAHHVADISHIAGLVAAGLHPSPFPHADVVTSTTHKTLRGPRGAFIACRKDFADRIDRVVFPGLQGGPHNHVTAAIARMGFEALRPDFKKYQKQVVLNAKALAASLMKRGFRLVTGGTDIHLMVIDCAPIPLGGMEAETLLESAGITANRNAIPGDASPFYPSGIRAGTPAVTTRGMKERDMATIAGFFERVLILREKPGAVKKEVGAMMGKFPLYE